MARGKRTDKQALEREERRQQVLELRRAGASIRAIARQLDITTKTVQADLKAALQGVIDETKGLAEQNRALDLERIDRALMSIDAKVRKGEVSAIDRMVRLLERRAKLLGLDAPTRQEMDHTTDGKPMLALTADTMAVIRERAQRELREWEDADADDAR